MRDIVPEHHIQRRIYNRLVGAESLRYSELRPDGLEANLFMYHLKELIKMGLVEKIDGGYSLTKSGRSTATRFSIKEQGIRIMPSTLSILDIRSEDGQNLLYRRRRQPYIDKLGYPSGKIHLGDNLRTAAERELAEKTSYDLKEVKLTYRGVFNLVEYEGGELKNHIIGHVWSGIVNEKPLFNNHAGETLWADWRDLNYTDFIPGYEEISQALETDSFFGLDLRFDN